MELSDLSKKFFMSVLSASDPVPRYARLAQLLRQRIDKGVWKAGEKLPRLEDLMTEFDVARVTVRQAIALLSQEGRVSVSRGRGTLVKQHRPVQRTLMLETSLADLAAAYRSDSPSLTLIDERRAELPELESGSGTAAGPYRFLKRVHSRDGEPYCVISIYLREDIFRLAPSRFRRQTVVPVLVDLPSVKIHRASQTLRISVADVETSNLLGVPLNSAVGEVTRIFHDVRGQILYFAEITYRADYIRFQMKLKV